MNRILCLLLPLVLLFSACGSAAGSVGSSVADSSSAISEISSVPELSSLDSLDSSITSSSEDTVTVDPEEEDVSILMFRTDLVSCLEPFNGEFRILEDRDAKLITIQIFPDGMESVATSAAAGNPDDVAAWARLRSALLDLNDSYREIAETNFLSYYHIGTDFTSAPDESDSVDVFLSALDGEITFDFAPLESADESLLNDPYLFASDEEKYTAASEAFCSHFPESDGLVAHDSLNFDFTPDGHPYFSPVVNYRDTDYSQYDFQSLVCDTLDFLQSLKDTYHVLYDTVSIYFRFMSADSYIEYKVYDTDDLYVGSITDDYNHVSGYDIPADGINAWYSGDDFSQRYAKANAPCTYEEYLQIADGMSYSEVVSIIGSDGTEMSRSSYGGNVAVVYSWDGSSKYATVIVEFLNDEVISKSQSGLNK